MPRYDVIFETEEFVRGVVPRANDWVTYKCKLTIKNGGKAPVNLDMKFIPPHPYSVNMPLEHSISANSLSDLYGKVTTFLLKYGVVFKG